MRFYVVVAQRQIWFAKPLYRVNWYRGFESLSLRHFGLSEKFACCASRFRFGLETRFVACFRPFTNSVMGSNRLFASSSSFFIFRKSWAFFSRIAFFFGRYSSSVMIFRRSNPRSRQSSGHLYNVQITGTTLGAAGGAALPVLSNKLSDTDESVQKGAEAAICKMSAGAK